MLAYLAIGTAFGICVTFGSKGRSPNIYAA
jgi:hypothetical protein